MDQITPKEVKILEILENPEDIQERREQVLGRYANFKSEARNKRDKLEDSRRFQYFNRDAVELEEWIYDRLLAVPNESYKNPTDLQAKMKKHQAFKAEVAAHSDAIVLLDNTGSEMIAQHHFASDVIRKTLEKLHCLWELLPRLADKSLKLQQAAHVQFVHDYNEMTSGILEMFGMTGEFGCDMEDMEPYTVLSG
jgi:spectrin alpha